MDTALASRLLFPLARTIVRRRQNIRLRAGLALLLASVFQYYNDPLLALIWFGVYALLLCAEYIAFRNVSMLAKATLGQARLYYALLTLNHVIFASFGLLLAFSGNVWGVVCAAILWTGMLAAASLTSGGSRSGLFCTLIPPMAAFLTLPYLVVAYGGGVAECITISVAGTINAACTVWVWHAQQRLLLSASEAQAAKRLALQDVETGLANRNALMRRVKRLEAAKAKDKNNSIVIVAAIGLDRFEHLRGAIGHLLMIDLLQGLAAKLADAYREAPVSRLSEAEFGLAFLARDIDHAHQIATQLQHAVTDPMTLNGNRVDVSITIGLCTQADEIASATALSIIDRALIAVDQARVARTHIARFDPMIYGDPGESLSLMSDMLQAIETDQISIAYQPKLNLSTGSIEGVEALVRWTHPARGRQRPDIFVEMAEQTGHIAELTEWVLRRAIRDQATLRAAGIDVRISVNWSGLLLNDEAFTRTALAIARENPCCLCFEVTETAIIGNAGLARQTLEQFRGEGIKVSIDDYGSGLSSLAYLKNIPADELKIDKAFVRNLASDPVDAVLVRSAVNLAHNLGLSVVAEGVESKDALDMLAHMGCDIAQGYAISHPVPLAELITFLQRSSHASTSVASPALAPASSN